MKQIWNKYVATRLDGGRFHTHLLPMTSSKGEGGHSLFLKAASHSTFLCPYLVEPQKLLEPGVLLASQPSNKSVTPFALATMTAEARVPALPN